MREFVIRSGTAPNNILSGLYEHLSDLSVKQVDISIKVTKHNEVRSDLQRKLVNCFYDQSSVSTGDDRTKMRNRIMYHCGLRIFERDDIIVNGVSSYQTICVIRELKLKGMVPEYKHLMKTLAASSTSSSFNVKQNHEYIENIWSWAINNGVNLHIPSDMDGAKFTPGNPNDYRN